MEKIVTGKNDPAIRRFDPRRSHAIERARLIGAAGARVLQENHLSAREFARRLENQVREFERQFRPDLAEGPRRQLDALREEVDLLAADAQAVGEDFRNVFALADSCAGFLRRESALGERLELGAAASVADIVDAAQQLVALRAERAAAIEAGGESSATRIRSIEEREEALLRACERAGLAIGRRPDADPSIVLAWDSGRPGEGGRADA